MFPNIKFSSQAEGTLLIELYMVIVPYLLFSYFIRNGQILREGFWDFYFYEVVEKELCLIHLPLPEYFRRTRTVSPSSSIWSNSIPRIGRITPLTAGREIIVTLSMKKQNDYLLGIPMEMKKEVLVEVNRTRPLLCGNES